MGNKLKGKKSQYINRNKLNEFKETLTPETLQIYNILSKNIFPRVMPTIEMLLVNIDSLNEKLQKKNRFNFIISKEMKKDLILNYLEVFPKLIQEEFILKHMGSLE